MFFVAGFRCTLISNIFHLIKMANSKRKLCLNIKTKNEENILLKRSWNKLKNRFHDLILKNYEKREAKAENLFNSFCMDFMSLSEKFFCSIISKLANGEQLEVRIYFENFWWYSFQYKFQHRRTLFCIKWRSSKDSITYMLDLLSASLLSMLQKLPLDSIPSSIHSHIIYERNVVCEIHARQIAFSRKFSIISHTFLCLFVALDLLMLLRFPILGIASVEQHKTVFILLLHISVTDWLTSRSSSSQNSSHSQHYCAHCGDMWMPMNSQLK